LLPDRQLKREYIFSFFLILRLIFFLIEHSIIVESDL